MKRSRIDILIEEYPGDEAWRNFVSASRAVRSASEDQTAMADLVQDEELAAVIMARMGNGGISWLTMQVPALDHRCPVEMVGQAEGRTVLRSLLMRMPLAKR